MAERTIVVLGGALSGPTAAARARELDDRARIVLVERNTRVSYAVGGLAYHLSGEVPAMDALDREDDGFLEAYYRVDVRKRTEAIALDPTARVVTLRDGAGAIERLAYDALIYGLGAASPIPDVPGLAGDNVRALRTMGDLDAVASALAAGARRFAIVGGGPFGLEAADGLVRRGAEVTLLERNATLLPRFGDAVSTAARRALAAKVDLRLGAALASAESANGKVTRLLLADGGSIAVDYVIVAAGVRPRTELLASAGVALHPDGTARIDDRTRTSAEGVFACGSCVSVSQVISGAPVWWPQAAIADKTAQIAGANAAGGDERLMPATGSMLIRIVDLVVARTGLSYDEARVVLGDDVARTVVNARSQDTFFPGAAPMLLELIWQRSTGRVIGVEASGQVGVDRRIDAASSAIAAGLGVEQLAQLDLGYSPPFGAARDPLNVVATAASSEHKGLGATISPGELRTALGSLQLVDVRPEGDDAGGIAGAKRIPITALRDRLDELDAAKPIVVFSASGRHGWLAVRILAQRGFPGARNLAGGLSAFDREGVGG